jgi:hypothetical protein
MYNEIQIHVCKLPGTDCYLRNRGDLVSKQLYHKLYLSILLHYFTYNITYTVTMQLIKKSKKINK